MSQSDLCMKCARYWGAHHCDAFPDGIPITIITGRVDHTKPYKGDRGLQFKESAEFREAKES